MSGVIALEGGGAFSANDDLDRELMNAARAATGASAVVVLPTADAFEHPERLAAAAVAWGERLGAAVEVPMVLRRADATDEVAARVEAAAVVVLAGDQPLHLRSVLKDTPVWAAIVALVERGGTVIAIGPCAAAVCDPMVDPRGGAFTLGLGLLPGVACVAGEITAERLHRTRQLANTPLIEVPVGAASVRDASGWTHHGEVHVDGDLP
jgi:cyanophycinase